MDGFAVTADVDFIMRELMRKVFHLSEVFSSMNLPNADTLVQTGSAKSSRGIFSAYESQCQNCRFNAKVRSPLHHYRCRHLENDAISLKKYIITIFHWAQLLLNQQAQIDIIIIRCTTNETLKLAISMVKEEILEPPLRLFYFHRMKLLGHPSALFGLQYRMVRPVEKMINNLFYEDDLHSAKSTKLMNRPEFKKIVKFLQNHYSVKGPVLLLKFRGESSRDSNRSLYNITNLNETLKLAISMIEERFLEPADITVMTFYRAQVVLYRQALRNLPDNHLQPGTRGKPQPADVKCPSGNKFGIECPCVESSLSAIFILSYRFNLVICPPILVANWI